MFTDDIIRFENGEMQVQETIDFFQKLIDTGDAWRLQGSYGRTANALITEGLCHYLPTIREVDPIRAASKVQGL